MSRFDTYKTAFPNAQLTRSPSGVLEVRFHTDGGKLVSHTHEVSYRQLSLLPSHPRKQIVQEPFICRP